MIAETIPVDPVDPVHPVHPAQPRTSVQVIFADGTILEGPIDTSLETFIQTYESSKPPHAAPTVAAVVDDLLRELTLPVTRDINVKLVGTDTGDGTRIYRRSLAFLLVVAVTEVFPGTQVVLDYALPSGAYFCKVKGRPAFNDAELAAIKSHMLELVAANEPIIREQIPLKEAIEQFQACGDEDKVRLLQFRTKDYLTVYRLRGEVDYFYGYMVPSTGYLPLFEILPEEGGFILQYPRRESPNLLKPYVKSPQMMQVFQRTEEWLSLLGVEDVGHLNQAIRDGRARELVLVNEALHEQHIAQIATEISQRHKHGLRLVLIAGPSSSGKTTFSKRLAIQIMAHGLKPYTLEMDRYFVDRELTPRDENGEFDFESLGAVDLSLFNEQMLALTSCQPVKIPHFNFVTGKQSLEDKEIHLSADHILIVEGIHGLNPKLVQTLPTDQVFRVYVSALTQLNTDRHNRVPTTDVRLIRRIVRDSASRGYSALDTLSRWESVRRGEKRNIFPYQENADVMFNSALVYELAVLRPMAEPLLLQIEPRQPHYIEARRLLSILGWLKTMDADVVPDNSLLREFIGGSILRDYMPGMR
ncbi:MAG: nucleoside kinase [Chloroflexi bacterium]|nr:nucleoside kinase [Chloroflexota bacterium]